ncbi:MAG: site-specific integrase [Nitrosomonas sp.]|nr:site-specific integrase [Nitrosomonas sp.]
MGGNKYPGVRKSSETTIEIDFYYKGQRCRERIQLRPTPANLKKAAQHRAAVLNAIDSGTFDYSFTFPNSRNSIKFLPTQYTVQAYLTEWLTNKKPTIKASTYNDYSKTIKNLLIPQFGTKLLPTLTRNDVRRWIANLNCSNKRLANIISPLRAALQDAHHDDLIPNNPLFGWTYKKNEPPSSKIHIDPFNESEQKDILSAATGQIRNQCVAFFWTGMRTSELIALEWIDIDWTRKKIMINKAITTASKTNETTKTSSGTREIDMLPPVEHALTNQKQYTLLQGCKVFHNPANNLPWTGDQAIRKSFWIPLLRKAKVRYRNPYQTRHTYASMMLSAGEPLAWVSSQMGHSNVLITAKTYARWIPNNNQQGSKALELYGQHLVNIDNR